MAFSDPSTGATYESVYVTTADGDEVASIAQEWTDALINKLEAAHGPIIAVYQGGDLDGFEA